MVSDGQITTDILRAERYINPGSEIYGEVGSTPLGMLTSLGGIQFQDACSGFLLATAQVTMG